MESGRLIFSSAAPCRAAGAGGGHMMLFGGSGSFLGGSPVVAGVEDGRRKRPFLTKLDEELQLEEDMYGYYLDEQAPERKRRLTAEQVVALERSFEEEKRKLDPERKSELARRLGMAPRQVAVWFQNRRARWKAKQLEHDFHALRAAHDELLAGRDSLLADNNRLRSQVTSLTEKLQAKESSPDVQTAASGTAHAGSAEATPAIQLNEGYAACAETNACNAEGLLAGFAGEANDSPESYSYFADARSPPSSSDDDWAGAVRGELAGCSFFHPADAMLDVGAVERESVEREEQEEAAQAQLNYWAWFWS